MNASGKERGVFSRAARRAALVVTAFLALAACKKAQPPAPPKQAHACTSNEQCDRGWICLAGKCADMATSALYKHPENAVSPAKIQAEMDRLNAEQAKNAERLMRAAEQER